MSSERGFEQPTEPAVLPDIGRWLSLMGLNVRNQFRNWVFFIPSWVLSLLQMVVASATFYFMGEYVGSGVGAQVQGLAASYGPYIVLGLLLNRVLEGTLSSFHDAFLFGYWATQFDVYMAHPGGVSAYMVGHLLNNYLLTAINACVSLGVAVALFRVEVAIPGLPSAIVILSAAAFSLLGLALLGASTFTLLNARQWESNPVAWLSRLVVILLGGVYFPQSVLSPVLQRAAEWVPQARALRAVRMCLHGVGGLSDPQVLADLRFLLLFGLVTLPFGVAAFALGMRKTQRDGSLSRWS